VNESPEVQAVLVSDLDVADVEVVDEQLDSFRLSRRSSREGEEAEVVIVGLENADDLAVGVVGGGFVSFV
jgi:hypothetical protein